MIVKCQRGCARYFDDEFRDTICPHEPFLANDGQNNFAYHPESYLGDEEPNEEKPSNEEANNSKAD